MIKKIFLLCLSFVLVCNFNLFASAVGNTEIESSYSIDNNRECESSSIIVVIKHEYSEMWKCYSPEDFDETLVLKVEDLFCADVNNKSLTGYNMNEYCQILKLTLKEPTTENVEKLLNILSANPIVEYASPNYSSQINLHSDVEDTIIAETFAVTADESGAVSAIRPISDELLQNQYGVDLVQADRAWGLSIGNVGEHIKIGIIDSGINEHPDFADNYSANNPLNTNFTDSDTINDTFGHGTLVASIIGARGGNYNGICGITWFPELINIKAYRPVVYDDKTICETDDDWIAKALNYAADNNIRIVNISGEALYSPSLSFALRNYGGLIVVAAGNVDPEKNEEATDVYYLVNSNRDNVIAVAACNSNEQIWKDTKYHQTYVDLFAPGEQIQVFDNNNGYIYNSGTSLAAPFVSGAAALLLSVNPNLTTEQLKELIINNVDVKSEYLGLCNTAGRLNVFNSMLQLTGNMIGDVNLDGVLNAVDARLILRYSSQLETPDPKQRILDDFNKDKYITAADSRALIQYYQGG